MIEAGRVESISDEDWEVFETPDGPWIVIRVEGQYYALRDRCGHLPQSMAGGRVTGHHWRCPQHGVTYDVRSGEVVDDHGFHDVEPLTTAACVVRDGVIWIDI